MSLRNISFPVHSFIVVRRGFALVIYVCLAILQDMVGASPTVFLQN